MKSNANQGNQKSKDRQFTERSVKHSLRPGHLRWLSLPAYFYFRSYSLNT